MDKRFFPFEVIFISVYEDLWGTKERRYAKIMCLILNVGNKMSIPMNPKIMLCLCAFTFTGKFKIKRQLIRETEKMFQKKKIMIKRKHFTVKMRFKD